jgi:ribonuclease R
VLSHNVPCGNLSQPAEVQRLLHRLGTIPIGQALKIGFLRSLMRARYDVEPLGHYGLAKKKYTHFTSPIRRYADLVVHRALFDEQPGTTPALKQAAEHISNTERNSADAERDSKDVKLYAFLKKQLGSGQPEQYPALVTDVRNFGFFVDVSGLAMSGLVPLSTVEDDFFVFDASRNLLVGRRTRRVIRLGDQVTVQVAKVDSFKKQVDFRLAPAAKTASRPAAPSRQPQRSQQRASERSPQRQSQWPQDREQSRGKSPPQPEKPRLFKTSSSRPQPPSRDAKSPPARPQSGAGTFRAGPARPLIPSSHSRPKFGGRPRRG